MAGCSKFLFAIALAVPAAVAGAANDGLDVHNKTIQAKTAEYEITAAYPQTGVKPIDDAIGTWVRDTVAQFKKEAAPDPDSAAGAWTLDLDYEVKRNDAEVFAVLVSELVYTGGAHPNHGFTSFNFLMPEGRRVELPEILDGTRGLQRLSTLATADLVKRLSVPEVGIDPAGIKNGAGPEWANFQTFVLQPGALEIIFPPYQVASYADGTQQASIPLAALHGVLRSDWRAAAASFDCAKAATPVERAICADAALARLDRETAAAYAGELAGASDADARQAITARQRRWLGERDSACRDQPEAARIACLGGVYRIRLTELTASH